MPAGHIITTLIRSDRIDARKKSQKKICYLKFPTREIIKKYECRL